MRDKKREKTEKVSFILMGGKNGIKKFYLLQYNNRTCILFRALLQYKQRQVNPMKKQITFIHCADLHLDSPFKGLSDIPSPILKNIRESTFIALTNLTNLAIQRKVDFVLMVGDVFDQEEQSMRAHIAIKKSF